MRIGCVQFAPQVGDVDNNLNRADAVLSRANPEELDLLVLPEMAFSGTCAGLGGRDLQCARQQHGALEPNKATWTVVARAAHVRRDVTDNSLQATTSSP